MGKRQAGNLRVCTAVLAHYAPWVRCSCNLLVGSIGIGRASRGLSYPFCFSDFKRVDSVLCWSFEAVIFSRRACRAADGEVNGAIDGLPLHWPHKRIDTTSSKLGPMELLNQDQTNADTPLIHVQTVDRCLQPHHVRRPDSVCGDPVQ